MKKLILLRHGQSQWNKENRFTGWVDVPLSKAGIEEAHKAGQVLKREGYSPKLAYTSYLKRAIKTLWLVLEEMDLMWLPVVKNWRLNEKHYGMLQGLNKVETAEKYGNDMVQLWRRSFDTPPQPIAADDENNPRLDPRYADLKANDIPLTESLKEVIERMVPYYQAEIAPNLKEKEEVLIAAHGNSLRALVMYIKNMSREEIVKFNIPTGIPYVFEFNDNLEYQKDFFIGDPDEIKKLMDQVANQAKGK